MDGGFDISSLLSSAGSSDAISNAMSILMKKPELIETIANELGLSGTGQKEGDGGNDMATSVSSEIEKKPSERQKSGDRESLLLALKPYLSEKRQGAIDIMISLGSLSDLVSRIDPNLLKTLLGGKNV